MPSLAELLDPMPGKVAVQVKTKDEISESGLFLPHDTAKSVHERRATQGTVIAIGEEDPDEDVLYFYCKSCGDDTGNPLLRFYTDEACDVHKKESGHGVFVGVHRRKFKLGDTVVFGKYTGTEIKYQPPQEDPDENVVTRKARPAPETVIIMEIKSILCVIRKPSEAANLTVRA